MCICQHKIDLTQFEFTGTCSVIEYLVKLSRIDVFIMSYCSIVSIEISNKQNNANLPHGYRFVSKYHYKLDSYMERNLRY